MIEKRVAAGLSSAAETVGLTGLLPFEVVSLPETKLQPADGAVRIMLDVPPGRRLDASRPISYRVHGGEAGIEVERNGRIVASQGATLPLVVPYAPRAYPAPPARGELFVDLTFWHTDGGRSMGQDVQWRVPVRWDAAGGKIIDLHFRLRA
jgi:hypothetical protein